MKPRVVVVEAPSEADREAVVAPLNLYDEAVAGRRAAENVAILLKDGQGTSLGGLWGGISFDWLFVDLLAVPEPWRGHDLGTALMREAEAVARRRGCRGLWLNTVSFQAKSLYGKLGLTAFGVIEDPLVGASRHSLSRTV